ncbi:hypothetical protein QBZ16_000865 [Prototheca wickerhamii]|uniref:Uncharacterized protein n=1 Tax=Prototheca wickerhamii TaxID=3111 RepID=A0AAD9IGS8_PROWI|nr:hypothetical protein QBZ16_000865 [Prototheca wickerhamii]
MASTRIEDCRRASHSRDEERHVELWTKLIPAALEDGSKESEEAVAEVAMLELHRISSSQTLQLASRGVLQAALKSSPGFQRAFATAVVKTAASRTGMPPNALLILVRWTCLLLLALDGASGAKALARLVEVQDQLLRQLATTKRGQGRLKAAVRVASQALRQDAARLLPAYEQALRASGSGLLASVLVASEREREAVSRATLEAFCGDKALGAREGLNEVALAAWRPVAAAWPAEVVAAALAPGHRPRRQAQPRARAPGAGRGAGRRGAARGPGLGGRGPAAGPGGAARLGRQARQGLGPRRRAGRGDDGRRRGAGRRRGPRRRRARRV